MDTNSNNLTDPPQPDAAHVTAPDGQAAVADTLSLADLNQTLGKNFKDKATALAALKETQSYVGRKLDAAQPQAAPAADPALASEVQLLKEQVFYANHPELKGHETIIKAMGSNPAEVVNTEAFKTYFEKAKVADEVAQTRSVVSSSPRLAQTQSTVDEAIRIANATGSAERTSEILASGIMNELQG